MSPASSPQQDWERIRAQLKRRLEGEADPGLRALAAAKEIERLMGLVSEVSAIRLRSVAELRLRGLSLAEIAALLSVTRERAAQLVRDARAAGYLNDAT